MTARTKTTLALLVLLLALAILSEAWCPGPAQMTNAGMMDWVRGMP